MFKQYKRKPSFPINKGEGMGGLGDKPAPLNQFEPIWTNLIWFELKYSSKLVHGLKRPKNMTNNVTNGNSFQKWATKKQQQHDKGLEA